MLIELRRVSHLGSCSDLDLAIVSRVFRTCFWWQVPGMRSETGNKLRVVFRPCQKRVHVPSRIIRSCTCFRCGQVCTAPPHQSTGACTCFSLRPAALSGGAWVSQNGLCVDFGFLTYKTPNHHSTTAVRSCRLAGDG